MFKMLTGRFSNDCLKSKLVIVLYQLMASLTHLNLVTSDVPRDSVTQVTQGRDTVAKSSQTETDRDGDRAIKTLQSRHPICFE